MRASKFGSHLDVHDGKVPIAIVGAGPAGLAAGCALHHANIPFVIFEGGKPIAARNHAAADDLAEGVGGAGLFSDGKFSFYPSGTYLYQLGESLRLQRAYSWCCQQLEAIGIGFETFPFEIENEPSGANIANSPVRFDGVKAYPAHYATLHQRKSFIQRLERGVNGAIVPDTSVTQISTRENEFSLELSGGNKSVTALGVIIATGRFGGLQSEEHFCNGFTLTPIRYEIGIRVETRRSLGFLNKFSLPDVKRIWHESDVNFRTFCTCRDGEIWNIRSTGLRCLSGRSDGPRSGFSNFGLLARFTERSIGIGEEIWRQLRRSECLSNVAVFQQIDDFFDAQTHNTLKVDPNSRPWFPKSEFAPGVLRDVMGMPLYLKIRRALLDLVEWSPELRHEDTICLFPAIEGIGYYPNLDENLRIGDRNMWSCGDVVGRFRGLVPSLVSGYYAGLSAAIELSEQSNTSLVAMM